MPRYLKRNEIAKLRPNQVVALIKQIQERVDCRIDSDGEVQDEGAANYVAELQACIEDIRDGGTPNTILDNLSVSLHYDDLILLSTDLDFYQLGDKKAREFLDEVASAPYAQILRMFKDKWEIREEEVPEEVLEALKVVPVMAIVDVESRAPDALAIIGSAKDWDGNDRLQLLGRLLTAAPELFVMLHKIMTEAYEVGSDTRLSVETGGDLARLLTRIMRGRES